MYYTYNVEWYCDFKDDEVTETGLVFGETYKQAAERVAKDYGENDITKLTLSAVVTDFDSFCISKEDIDYVFENDN